MGFSCRSQNGFNQVKNDEKSIRNESRLLMNRANNGKSLHIHTMID